MCGDKNIFNKLYKIQVADDTTEETSIDQILTPETMEPSDIQAEIFYSQLSDSFNTFFKGDYTITGYELTDHNVKNLNRLKWRYRKAVILVFLSVIGMAMCYVILERRRELSPFKYGCILSICYMILKFFLIMISTTGVRGAVRDMILHQDYGFFEEGDVILNVIPPDFARYMSLLFVGYVIIIMMLVLCVRNLIRWFGKPHKF